MTGTATTDGRRTAPDRPATDDRGVSEIIGAILMFGLVLLLLVVIQATAVPMWNQQAEFEHSQRVQADWQEFDAAAATVAADGRERTVVVETGVRYPSRPFLLNPGPASGSIETMPARPLVIENADVEDDNGYWGATETFETRALRYRPNYQQYRNGPTTVYETGMLHNQHPRATLMLDDGNIVSGRSVNLQVLDDEYSAARAEPTSLDVQPTSAPARTAQMRSRTADPIVIRLPTLLDEETLRDEVLADEIDPAGPPDDPDRYVQSVTVTQGSPYNTAEITLEPGVSYSLTMSEIGIGSADRAEAAYITRVGPESLLVPAPSTTPLTVEVRDRYNNPVAGETVTFEVAATSSGDFGAAGKTVTVQTDPEGRATAEYEAPSVNTTGNVVTASVDDGSDSWETVSWTIESNTEVGVGGPGGGSPEDAVSTINPGPDAGVPYIEGVVRSGDTVTLCFDNPGDSTDVAGVRVPMYVDSGGSGSTPTNIDVEGTDMQVYEDFKDPNFAIPSGGREVDVTITKTPSGIQSDVFILSLKFDTGGTWSYFVGVPQSGGSCP